MSKTRRNNSPSLKQIRGADFKQVDHQSEKFIAKKLWETQARAEAMIIRDDEEAGDGVSKKEWKQINSKLLYSYKSLVNILNQQ